MSRLFLFQSLQDLGKISLENARENANEKAEEKSQESH